VSNTTQHDHPFILSTQNWLEQVVIGLNLCPFAKREFIKNRIRYQVCHSDKVSTLLKSLEQALTQLANNPEIETTLIIHPHVLQHFEDYNDFLDLAEQLLFEHGHEGAIQIASFHPDYQFANTQQNDPENFTNRSPFPLIHLLREDRVEKAIATYPNPEKIPANNIALMKKLGSEKLQQLINGCLAD
jgi:hypothetical protein